MTSFWIWLSQKPRTLTVKSGVEIITTWDLEHKNCDVEIRPIGKPWVSLTEEDRQHLDEEQLGWNDLLTATDALLEEKNA